MKAIFTIRQDFLGDVIVRLDGGPYNHCGIYDEAGTGGRGFIIEAIPFEGVRKRPVESVLSSAAGVGILDLQMPDEEYALKWLRQQVGRKYDLLGLLGIALGADWLRDDRWVCSPLTMMTFIQAGASLDGGPQPGFNYVMGVSDAYKTLISLGARTISSISQS